jgi:hypothetical protein
MALDFATVIPPSNLRLPDALTIKYEPAPLLARFILEADKTARAAGIHLRLRNDFERLAELNEEQVERGNWYPLINMFNPARSDISPANAFWVSGENDKGEIVCTNAARIYDWSDTNLEEQAVAMLYGRDDGQPCIITAEAAKTITGVVQSMGATWVRPDCRGRQLSHLLPRVSRAYGAANWPVDWVIAYITMAHVHNGIAFGYGARHFSSSVVYPDTHFGELVLAYTSHEEVCDDLTGYLATELSGTSGAKFAERSRLSPTFLAQEVMSTSPDGVRQGSSKRS